MTEVSGRIDLTGKVAIVTGGARGIGQAVARALAREGAAVAVADVGDGGETIRAIQAAGGRAIYVRTDVTSRSDVRVVVRRTVDELGGLHILVNNAGTVQRVGLEELTEELWDRDVDTIMRGTYLVTQAAYPTMVAQRYGKIVNVSSVSGRIGGAVSKAGDAPEAMKGRSGPAYAAAKGGVLAFTKWVAKDGGRHNIQANAVCPGPISTEMTRGYDYNVAGQPIARMGEPDDVAEAVVFLASNAANYITGQGLNVDGGLVMD
jgi:3-oxoacyl-[acyl-carrier protein] reductase